LREPHKVPAIGIRGGGIAHDFNNVPAISMSDIALARAVRGIHADLPLAMAAGFIDEGLLVACKARDCLPIKRGSIKPEE
jgi:hypothetical protein